MKDFINVLRRFAGPYMKYFYLNVFFTILGAIAGIFSFAMIIPVLQLLFGIGDMKEGVQSLMTMPETSGLKAYFDALKDVVVNNFYYRMGEIIDLHGPAYGLIAVALFLVAMTLLKTGFTYLGAFFMIPLRSGIVRDLRNMMYHKLVAMPMAYFSEKRKGDVMSRITGDVQAVEVSVVSSLEGMIKNPILILMYFVVMVLVSWQLTLFVMVLLPISVFFVGRISKTLKRTSNKGQIQLGVILSQIEETLGGLRVIKAFTAEEKVKARFSQANERFRIISNRLARKRQSASPVSEFLGTLIIAIVLCYGGSLILNENSTLSAEAFIFYLLMFYNIVQPAKALSTAVFSVQKGMASLDRIDEVLDAENTIVDAQNAEDLSVFKSSIAYEKLTFKYDKEAVLKNINIHIKKGETIALVGKSGSGKTTLAELLPRFYDATEGQIKIDGRDIRELTMKSLRSHMGYVNQEPILFNDSFFNNIAFGVDKATEEEVIAAAKVANAHDFIMETEEGYQTNVGDRGGRLSGGQRQRISIARAILANPEILILDEATSALDTESERLVQDALENLMKNRTTLVIAHRLSTIKNADCIYVIDEGEVIEQGKHEELMSKKAAYYKLQKMQSF